MTSRNRLRAVAIAAVSVGMLSLNLVGCAPEPGDIAGSIDKNSQTMSPESEASEREVSEYVATTELPESFPSESFQLPDSATIEDAGERAENQWFVVLRASNEQDAESQLQQIIGTNQFEEGERTETVEGGHSVVLSSATLVAHLLTIPQTDGTVQLSFDLQSTF